jgi:hypothetical protein
LAAVRPETQLPDDSCTGHRPTTVDGHLAGSSYSATSWDDQRQANARQAEVLRLQADELRESLEKRKREAEGRRRAQASKVFVWQDHIKDGPMGAMTATAHAKKQE